MPKDYSVTVNMPRDPWQCLVAMAVEDLRKPDEFMLWLLYREARQRGMLETGATEPVNASTARPTQAVTHGG